MLKKIREDRDVKAQTLANYLGVDRKTLYNWENGKDIPSSMLLKIADFFHVSTDEILGRKIDLEMFSQEEKRILLIAVEILTKRIR